MQIQGVNSYSINQQKPCFKSAYPVIHWIAENNGSYAPVASEQLTRKLQGKLVRYLNLHSKSAKPSVLEKIKSVFQYIFSTDKDYNKYPIARSFYNRDGGFSGEKFEPISYLITGRDADFFEETLAKPVGRSKREAPSLNGKYKSGELNIALGDYWNRGLDFVKKQSKNFYDSKGIPNELHTKFIVVRNKNGKIKDYNLVGMKFLPSTGPKNPFERLGMVKSKG